MTPFEQDLIEALKQIGATDWAGYIINLVGIVIASAFSARVAFKIAKYQTEKQLTKQNILETKKEKRMLATQIRLDKYEDLYASLTEYARLISQSYLNVLYYTHSDEYSDKITIEQLRVNEDDLQQEILLKGNKTEILSAYHPEIMNEWNVLSKMYEEIADIICLYIYGATNKDISKLFGVKAASGVYLRDCYRDVQIPFQTMKKKRLGKMVFTYDRSLVEKYYNNLADDLKLITKCFIFEDRLQAVTKIRASEVIL